MPSEQTSTVPLVAQEHKHPRAIALTVDRKYLPHALFVIDQIAALHPNRDFDFCILTNDDLPHHALIQTHSIRISKLSEQEILKDFAHSERISVATYLRFFVARQFPEYERILYLDSDLFIRRGDFSRLLRADIGPHAIAAARDPAQFRHPGRLSRDMRALKLPYFPYASAGVLLIDTARFAEEKISERALELALARPQDMELFDQTALNATLLGNFAELPAGWNWLYGFRTLYFTELYDPPILHFAGRRKPWNTGDGQFPVRYGKAYRDFYQRHFPDLVQTLPTSQGPSNNKLAHIRVLFNHMNGLRRLVPAFDAFDGDFDIRF